MDADDRERMPMHPALHRPSCKTGRDKPRAPGYPGAQEPLVQVAQARDDGPDISAFICS
jgi:hypothetical protein